MVSSKDKLSEVEKKKLLTLFSTPRGYGYVLDFSDISFKKFVISSIRIDIYKRFPEKLSKGKMLIKAIEKLENIKYKKLIVDLLKYMNERGLVTDLNKDLFKECSEVIDLIKINKKKTPKQQSSRLSYSKMMNELKSLKQISKAQKRGYSFEVFLNNYFKMSGLKPEKAFKIDGDQIDGSFELDKEIYLLEAKWHKENIQRKDIDIFDSKVSRRSHFTHGLFISYSEFGKQMLSNLSKGTVPRVVLATVSDIEFILNNKIPLKTLLNRKARLLAEKSLFYVSAKEIFKN